MKTHTGFTLIEVLVALMILAFSVTASVKVISDNTRHLKLVRDKTTAQWSAGNALSEVRDAAYLRNDPRIAANSSIPYEDTQLGQDWYVSVEFRQDPDAPEDILIAIARAYRSDADRSSNKSPVITLTDYIINPQSP